jgi:hypothetical protein
MPENEFAIFLIETIDLSPGHAPKETEKPLVY